ncbi:hypothetical protein FGIG_05394, partial [Fasciola gigantica]
INSVIPNYCTLPDFNVSYCQAEVDGVNVCWPPTPVGETASVACPERFHIYQFSGTGSSTRYCHNNGTWHSRADYSNCSVVAVPFSILHDPYMICYICGYLVSSIAVIIGIAIFQYFTSLKCVRNGIHTNFMLSLLIRAIIWFSSATITSYPVPVFIEGFMATLRAFILSAVYCWMLVEGLHLMNILFFTMVSHRLNLSLYCAIGWGIPALLALAWAVTKLIKGEPEEEWQNPSLKDPEGKTVLYSILGMLAINLCFTLITVYTLLRKVYCRSGGSHQIVSRNDRKRVPLISFATKNRLLSRASIEKPLDSNELPTAAAPHSLADCQNKNGFSVSFETDSVQGRGSSASVIRYPSTCKKSSNIEEDQRFGVNSSGNVGLDTAVRPQKNMLLCNGYRRSKSSSTSTQGRRTHDSASINTSSLFEPWKAVKAILFLMPLLGYPQLLFLRPYQRTYEYIFNYINAFLISTQVSHFH